jgi:uncharacterized LabA/DUF88 family protein
VNRTAFLVDGFNLYHSLKVASKHARGARTRWLNLRSLCSSYLHAIGHNAQITEIVYFSALAIHLELTNPGITKRHKDYIGCLQNSGVTVELNRFKRKDITCPACHSEFVRYEEKETDVALAVRLIELLLHDSCDTVVLVTGDTDVAPAVRTSKILFPQKQICFLFPYRRHNVELVQIADLYFDVKIRQYLKHQFPDPYACRDGSVVPKPPKW